MPKSKKPVLLPRGVARAVKLYTLDVVLLNDPVPADLAKKRPVAGRAILLGGKHTLADLHQAIAGAFGCKAEQSYEFQFTKGPGDPEGPRYVLPGAYEISVEDGKPAAGRSTDTTLNSLKLRPGQCFVYWSDDGDGWWHQITVRSIDRQSIAGKFPKLIERTEIRPRRALAKKNSGEEPRSSMSDAAAADTACLIGDMHLKKGAYAKAIEAFSRAIAVSPTADAYEGRAKAYHLLGAVDERSARALLDASAQIRE